MSEYTIDSNQKINWQAKGMERILQNISNVLNTYMYEVAYDRIMGRNPSNIDKSQDKMIPAIIAETYELIEEYEPRATVKDVIFEGTFKNGEPSLKVVLEIGE